jgi:hypothetical protein
MAKRRGRPSAAQTPAPKSDKLVGSSKNKAGSATAKGSSKIDLSNKTLKSLKQKLDDFKKNNPKKKNVSINDLKAVYRRGSGAFSTSHRPNMNRAGWAYARVNKFLKKAAGKKVKAAYVQDDDLLKYEEGALVLQNVKPKKEGYITKFENGFYWLIGVVDGEIENIDGDKKLYVVKDMAKRWGYKLITKDNFKKKYGNVQYDDLLEKGGKTFNDKELLAKWKKGESIGFTGLSHLKAKGLIPRADGEKRKSEKYMEDGGETPELEVVVIQEDSKLENDAYDVIRYGELGNTGKARLALLEDEKLVGAIYVEPAQEYTLDGKKYVDPMFEYKFDIYVKKSKRGKGYSKILLDYMIADFLYNFDDDCDQIRAEVINKKLEVNLEKNYGFNCDSMNDENITYCYLSREDAKKISKKLKLSKLTMETKYAEGGKVKRKLKAKGDCYRAAADFCMGKWFAPNQIEFVGIPYLVHAEVKGQGMIEGIRYGHAWIEDDVNVYDFSNNREVILPKEIYYILGDVNTTDPKKYQKYTFEEARAKMLETKHYGSWDIETEYAEGGETTDGYKVYVNGEYRRTITDDNLKQYYLSKGFEMNNGKLQIYGNDIMFEDGGEPNENITCVNCSWQWNTVDSDESDKYVCHKCGFDNSLFYNGGMLKPTLTLAQIAEANLMKDYLKPVSIEYLQEQLIKGTEHEMEHTDNEEIATTIALHHLAERPDYYVELEKLNLEEGGELEDVIVENNSPKEIEIAMFLQEEKAEAQDVMTCHDTKIFKAMMCKAKVEIADNRMSNTENPEELNVWQAYKNIWQDCLDRIVTGNLPPAREYKEGGQPCGCGQKYSKGGLAYGNSHDKGGMPMKVSSTGQEIEIEGGEGVINKRSMKSIEKVEFQGKKMTPCEVVSKINQIGGGVKFKCEEVSEIIAEDGNF